ncbi:hypothetical protein [Methanoplanus limicola]|uniref:Uncharacterized protein n=1 Tax=Methanoplanus limicola DSM 2279 TaxID=937775 RepID=H1Z3T5_9EURY|nr:hypothetical protein [Methanoplanus limicola]EHQ36557.1 hypothetical protein Metlim_2512 [Methanoplanus limicola DSM 2279]
MEIKRKNKIFLLFAVSLMALCFLSCGCTSQSESADTTSQSQAEITAAPISIPAPEVTRSEMTGEEINPEEMPSENVDRAGTEAGIPGGMEMPGDVRVEPDLALAAETLGVTEDQLIAVLGGMGGGADIDLNAAASELGVTVEELEEALGPQGGMPPGGRVATS